MEKKKWQIKLGLILMISSGVFFAILLIFPLLDLPVKIKTIGSAISFVLMELVFWTGGLLVGKELFVKYKNQLNPRNWFREKLTKSGDNSESLE